MKVKTKLFLKSSIWVWKRFWIIRNSKKHVKDKTKISLQYRNDYLLKKAEALLRDFNIKVQVFGYENIVDKGNTLIVSNHADNIDGFAMIVALKKTNQDKNINNRIPTFLVKAELKADKFSRSILDWIDSFYIDRDSPRQSANAINDLIEYSKKHRTYPVVFPSGTRSKDDTIGTFKSASFKIAKKGFFNILPVTINNSLNGFNWNKTETQVIEVHFHKPIKANEIANLDTEAISNRVYKIIESKFKKPEITEEIKKYWEKEQSSVLKYKEKLAKINEKEKTKKEAQLIKEEKLIKKLTEKEKAQAIKEKTKDDAFKVKMIEKDKKAKEKALDREKGKNE
ncbi:lysophospholipid acyltransferase family protein [[Mycoplasma] mobile]|uniref:1-acyl-sn-glycerol-3-phosphate acyltransferase n=1 Tax=Mycoplasma mobile (strain ATCC 43663 / 163K / NCTC 11711) TaxID=267748 RepID=Q6KHG6_MYCM1|nr:lysophospholipid acyltransferase family protein [[Mycoplasma] mobile]AAT27964.1 1-acyl-sn-glycerol-3-phosphate acyltransferase [Mycoplasma mobile 163K]